MCVQSSVSAEVNVEKRSGTATESVLGRMMALGEGVNGIWDGWHVNGRLRK
jgi:hypothetical protein